MNTFRHCIGASILALGVAGCSDAPRHPARASTQYVVAIDRSGSRSADQQGESQRALNALITQVHAGDALSLLDVKGGSDDKQWYDSAATPRSPSGTNAVDLRREQEFRELARAAASALFDSSNHTPSHETNLFATLFQVADYARASGGRRTVVLLLSDGVNESDDVNMARNGAPSASWIARRKALGLLPDLKGACIAFVGVEVGTVRAAELKAFWQRYLETASAEMGAWTSTLIDASSIGCSNSDPVRRI